MELQFASQAWEARSPQLLKLIAENAFVETSPKEGKTPVPVYGTPGLSLWTRGGQGPIWGMHVGPYDNLYFISGSDLYVVKGQDAEAALASGAPVPNTFIGHTTLGGGLISMADNGYQIVMVDGSVGWIYQATGVNQVTTATAAVGATSVLANVLGTINSGDPLILSLDNGAKFSTTATTTVESAAGVLVSWLDALPSQMSAGAIISDPVIVLAQITAPAFYPGANTVAYFDDYFVFDAAGTQQFFLSAIGDGTQYSGLDYASATATSSNMVAVWVYHEQLLLFTHISIEVWWDAGSVTFPFQRFDAAFIQRGLASPRSICAEDNTIFWMGEDGTYYRLNGYLPQRISQFAIERQWGEYPEKFNDCSAFVLDQEGHKFIVLNFQSACKTWVYDIATGLWHQRQSYGTPWV